MAKDDDDDADDNDEDDDVSEPQLPEEKQELSKPESSEDLELFDRNAEYQIRPSLVDKFQAHTVQEIIHSILHEELGGKTYSVEESEEWTKKIVSSVKDSVKEMGFKRYKLIVQIILGQNKGSGVKIGARCLWDADTDNYASDYFLSDTMFCCVIVFGIYCY